METVSDMEIQWTRFPTIDASAQTTAATTTTATATSAAAAAIIIASLIFTKNHF